MPLSTRYQTTTPYESLADFLARLIDPDGSADEGLYWGGATAIGDFGGSGTTYPAFLAMVEDDNGRMWPTGATSNVTVEFVDSSGACSLYLIPFSDEELPSYVSGQIGDFSLVAQLTDPSPPAPAPANALKLGSGSVTASAFTTWTEDPDARAKVTASCLLPLANLTGLSAGDLLKYDGSSRFERVPCTAAGLALLDDADAAAQRTTLGVTAANVGVASSRGYLAPTSNITIGSATWTAIDWTGHSRTLTGFTWDSGNPTRITFTEGGVYLVNALVTWEANATGQRQMAFRLNGSTDIANQATPGTNVTYAGNTLNQLREYAANDYLELRVYQNSGGNLSITGSSNWTYWRIVRIAP